MRSLRRQNTLETPVFLRGRCQLVPLCALVYDTLASMAVDVGNASKSRTVHSQFDRIPVERIEK